jgi:hypothetical protein
MRGCNAREPVVRLHASGTQATHTARIGPIWLLTTRRCACRPRLCRAPLRLGTRRHPRWARSGDTRVAHQLPLGPRCSAESVSPSERGRSGCPRLIRAAIGQAPNPRGVDGPSRNAARRNHPRRCARRREAAHRRSRGDAAGNRASARRGDRSGEDGLRCRRPPRPVSAPCSASDEPRPQQGQRTNPDANEPGHAPRMLQPRTRCHPTPSPRNPPRRPKPKPPTGNDTHPARSPPARATPVAGGRPTGESSRARAPANQK